MKKIPVGILGATGAVGQKMIELLIDHPWFEIVALAASDKSLGKTYGEIAWRMGTSLPENIRALPLLSCSADFPCTLLFSALDSAVAGEIEETLAYKGYYLISNASHHRLDPEVPLLIPEVNRSHLSLIESQRFSPGLLITNPNCSVVGLSMVLKPLIDQWGVEAVHVTTLQALSGAGYPGVASLDILDNVIPYIEKEEEKIETEPLKILGPSLRLSAHCTRVPVSDGHLACVSVQLKRPAQAEELIACWNHFPSLSLPSAPLRPLIYLEEIAGPQPKRHRLLEKGMAVSVGRLRPCPLLDWKFVLLSHNTIRGAAGCALLNAELLVNDYGETKQFSHGPAAFAKRDHLAPHLHAHLQER